MVLSFAARRRLGRLRGARFRLLGERFEIFCPTGLLFRRPAKFGTPARRAARRGRLWGYAPFSAPLASPPKHPLRAFSISARWRGHASCAAGASLTRCARSGDLPPRRVNAIVRIRSVRNPLQPNPLIDLVRYSPSRVTQPSRNRKCFLSRGILRRQKFLCLSPPAIKSGAWRRLP